MTKMAINKLIQKLFAEFMAKDDSRIYKRKQIEKETVVWLRTQPYVVAKIIMAVLDLFK